MEKMCQRGEQVLVAPEPKSPSQYTSNRPMGILFNRHFNKGTAFTFPERKKLALEGLLPGKLESIQTQVRRCLKQLRHFESPITKYIYLSDLRERSDTLFYKLVMENLTETLPIIYTPTVGQACLEFGLNYRTCEGMYFSRNERGRIRELLDNWKPDMKDQVAIVVLTDGSRILGLGDLGTCGMGIPIGKLSLYVAAAGFHPATTLPVVIDTGTNNKDLIEDEFYLGCRHTRLSDIEFYPLVDEFMTSCADKWPDCVIQFEDFSNDHAFDLLEKYRHKMRCFNDDIQGTGAVIAAGFVNALKMTGVPIQSQRIVFFGAGAAGIGVVEQLCAILQLQFNFTLEEAKKLFYMVDSKGLITATRGDDLAAFKKPWVRHDIREKLTTLPEVVRTIQVTGVIGLSGQANAFTQEIISLLCQHADRPIIFPLSNPTKNSECTAELAISISKGKCIFCSGSPFPPVTIGDRVYYPSQGNNMYIFPGLGYGAWIVGAREVSDGMIAAAASCLAGQVTAEMLGRGEIFPPLSSIRAISVAVATAVIKQAVAEGFIDEAIIIPEDLENVLAKTMYTPEYLNYKTDESGRYRFQDSQKVFTRT